MKNNSLKYLVAALLVSLSFMSCRNNEEKLKDAQKDVLEAQKDLIKAESESIRDYEKYKMKTSKTITDNELKIADLKIKAIDGSVSQKKQYNERVADLEAKNTELKSRLSDYASYSADTWEEFKKDIDERTAALQREFDEINARKK